MIFVLASRDIMAATALSVRPPPPPPFGAISAPLEPALLHVDLQATVISTFSGQQLLQICRSVRRGVSVTLKPGCVSARTGGLEPSARLVSSVLVPPLLLHN